MDDSSDDDLEIGPQKSAEELLRERERLAEARGDVVDVGADDADAAMPPPVSPPCFAMPSLSAKPTRSGLPVGPLISWVMYQTCCGRLAAVR